MIIAHFNMDFGANETPVQIIKDWAFGRTYFRDIYSGGNNKSYKNSLQELDEL